MTRSDSTPPLEWYRSGRVPYAEAFADMQSRVHDIRSGRASECVRVLEHPPTLTAGTSADDTDLLDPDGIEIHRTGRGGQWTWHGPGQCVAYVMLDLARPHGSVPPRDVRAYVAGLERWLIATLAVFDVRGETRAGRVGIWVVDPRTGAENKIAAIGVRVTSWVTWHGAALNVSPDLAGFGRIVPCGIAGHGVTSLARLGVAADPETVAEAMRAAWPATFG